MQDLIKQEQFELEVLDRLKSGRHIDNLIFTGGTMLRLCFGLNRFSVDLDFWTKKTINWKQLFVDLKEYLSQFYSLKDSAHKFYTLLFEIRSIHYPRSLKIEIRKDIKKIKTEQAIAYSKHSNVQVLLTVVSLQEMLRAKIEAFLQRKEIRDVFDMEFLLKKGVALNASKEELKEVLKAVDLFTKEDYQVKLGSILEEEQRKYYIKENFKILKSAINEKLTSP